MCADGARTHIRGGIYQLDSTNFTVYDDAFWVCLFCTHIFYTCMTALYSYHFPFARSPLVVHVSRLVGRMLVTYRDDEMNTQGPTSL